MVIVDASCPLLSTPIQGLHHHRRLVDSCRFRCEHFLTLSSDETGFLLRTTFRRNQARIHSGRIDVVNEVDFVKKDAVVVVATDIGNPGDVTVRCGLASRSYPSRLANSNRSTRRHNYGPLQGR